MRLETFEILPKGKNGLSSGLLDFGAPFTFIKGPNGSGKSPLLLSIEWCLGYPARFKQDILDVCESAQLRVSVQNEIYVLSRPFSKPSKKIELLVKTESTGKTETYTSEKAFSEWFFGVNAIPYHALTSHGSKAYPYTSTLIPCFCIDQDDGWSKLYHSASNFLTDQRQEMTRILLGLPTKHSFEKKGQIESTKTNLEVLNAAINRQKRIVEDAKTKLNPSLSTSIGELDLSKAEALRELEKLKSGFSGLMDPLKGLEGEISTVQRKIEDIDRTLHNIGFKIKGAQKVREEIGAEADALALNQEATQHFRTFCGNTMCAMFQASEGSYGKSLLYLKDQLKDLENSFGGLKLQEEQLRSGKEELEGELTKLLQLKKQAISKDSKVDSLASSIERWAERLVSIEGQISNCKSVAEAEAEHSALIARRAAQQGELNDLQKKSPSTTSEAVVYEFLSSSMNHWVKILETQNLRGPANIDRGFGLKFGPDLLKAHKGSTLTRIILAYHTAILETSLHFNRNHPGVLLLDAPKQHELEEEDLKNYIAEIRKLDVKHPGRIQVCMSYTEANIKPGKNDKLWLPKFKGKEQKMFLG